MHVPDGFLTTGTAITAGALSASTVGIALRQTRTYLQDRQIPLAGLARHSCLQHRCSTSLLQPGPPGTCSVEPLRRFCWDPRPVRWSSRGCGGSSPGVR